MDAELLRSCFTFKTLDEHAEFFVRFRNLPLSQKKTTLERLYSFYASGLLIEEDALRSQIFQDLQPSLEETSKIEVIGIQTAGRTVELDRMLESLIANLTKFNKNPEIVVSDDSKPPDLLLNIETIVRHQKTYTGKITHLTWDMRRGMADEIAEKSGISQDICRFIFCPEVTGVSRLGAGRNSLLFHAQGKKILMLDDDVIIRTHRPINKKNGLTLSSSFQNGYSYFSDRQEAFEYFPLEETDYIGSHEQWLGRKASDILTQFGRESVIFESLPGGLSPSLVHQTINASHSNARIFLTHSGSIGDSWSRCHSNFDASPRRPHDLFGTSNAEFLSNMETPFVSRIDDTHVLYQGSACIGLNMAIDGRDFIPPFPPLYRGQDNVFGWLTSQILPSHFSFRTPTAIEHIRPEVRKRNPDEFGHLSTLGVVTRIVLELCLDNTSKEPAEKLKMIGNNLINFSKTSSEDIEILIISEISKRVNAMSYFASTMKAHYQKTVPEWWLIHISELISSIKRRMSDISSQPLLSDQPGIDFRKWLSDLGTAFMYWPDILKINR